MQEKKCNSKRREKKHSSLPLTTCKRRSPSTRSLDWYLLLTCECGKNTFTAPHSPLPKRTLVRGVLKNAGLSNNKTKQMLLFFPHSFFPVMKIHHCDETNLNMWACEGNVVSMS